MPVLFDSSAAVVAPIAGSASSGSAQTTHNASPAAANLCALAALSWAGGVNPSAATFGVEFGGQPMTLVPGGQQLWPGNQGITELYYLLDPPTGPQPVQASFTGMPTSATQQLLSLASATYPGVASVGPATTAAGSGGSPALSVPSASGQMVVAGFTTSSSAALGPITNFNQTSRYNLPWASLSNDPLLIGDAAGAATVNFTAQDSTAASWAGIGVALTGSAVAYDSVGAGGTSGGQTTGAGWAHTLGASANAALTFVTALSPDPNLTVTANAGTTAMIPLGSVMNFYQWAAPYYFTYEEFYVHFFAFGLLRPPTAQETFSITADTASYMAANSVAYTGVTGFGDVITAAANAETLMIPSTTPANRVVAAYGVSPQVNTFGFNQTQRAVAAHGADQLLLLGDAPGAGLVVSTATTTSPNGQWGAVGANLTPAIVDLDLAGSLGPIAGSVSFSDYRVHTPSPLRTYSVPVGSTEVVTSFGRVGPTWTQAADAVLDYTFDFTNWLAGTGDSVAAATFTPVSPGLTVVSVNVTATQATGWLTGGVTGDVYPVIVHIVTEYGRQYDQTFNLIIQQT